MKNKVKLKPCPFCGGEAEKEEMGMNLNRIICCNCRIATTVFFRIRVSDTGMELYEYKKIPEKYWNRRKP